VVRQLAVAKATGGVVKDVLDAEVAGSAGREDELRNVVGA